MTAPPHRLIFTGSAAESVVELADFTAESANSTTDSVVVGRLSLFNVLNPLESADGKLA